MSEIVSSDAVNQVGSKPIKTRSTFPVGYNLLNTLRFGEYSPHFVAEAVPGDSLPLRCSHDVRSLNLKSPLMQDIQLKKDYFQVPMEAILPLNWDKIQTNPLHGDDVDPLVVGCTVDDFPSKVYNMCDALQNWIGASGNTDSDNLTAVLRFMLFAEMFYSRGSLCSTMGLHLSKLFYAIRTSDQDRVSFDQWFEYQIAFLKSTCTDVNFTSDGVTYEINEIKNDDYRAVNYVSWRQALCIMRENMDFVVNSGTFSQAFQTNALIPGYSIIKSNASYPVNLARFFAYQIVCSHFYTNDKIDYVYDANLYRQLIGGYFSNISSSFPTFTINGLQYYYDYCSTAIFNYFYGWLVNGGVSITSILPYFRAIFGYNRSLRYEDYFTGSRSQPLAVGDVNVAVANNSVSVVDVTRKIQVQKFLNQVNRIGRQTSEYVKGIFGVEQKKDFHNPLFLAHTSDTVFGSEIENTGANQSSIANSTTSVLRSNASKYEFNVQVDRFSIIIGISYFDIKRVYINSVDRTYFHKDRYDMFNPFMQFIGDQSVYKSELDASQSLAAGSFGYQQRYAEYKNRLDVAAGGFADFLPSWSFLFSNYANQVNPVISPDYIRAWQTELDQFYTVMSNYSLGGYFHFIVKSVNSCDASRPMAFAPSIL